MGHPEKPVSRTLAEEGILIPPTLLISAGKVDEVFLKSILQGLTSPDTSRGDFNAQIAANLLGAERLQEVLKDLGD